MPVVKKSFSLLGRRIAPKIKNFMLLNQKAMINGATEEEGLEAIAEAIAYGVALALGDSTVASTRKAGFAPIITAPPVPLTVGVLLDTVLSQIELANFTEI